MVEKNMQNCLIDSREKKLDQKRQNMYISRTAVPLFSHSDLTLCSKKSKYLRAMKGYFSFLLV